MASLKTIQYHGAYFNKKIIIELNLLEGKNKFIKSNISIDGERFEELDIIGVMETLKQLTEEALAAKTKRGTDYKVRPRFIVFVDNLAAFYTLFHKGFKIVHQNQYDLCGSTISDMILFTTEFFEFRDLYCAAAANNIEDFYKGAEKEETNMDVYEKWLKIRMRDLSLADIKYSRVYGDIKAFRKEHKEEVAFLHDFIQDILPPFRYYMDLVWKTSHNDVGVVYTNKLFENELCNDVISIDRKSFFPYLFITEKFPVEKFEEFGNIEEEELEFYFNSGWGFECEITMEYCDMKYPGSMPAYPHIKRTKEEIKWYGDENDYALLKEFYDYSIIKINYGFLSKKKVKLPKNYRKLLLDQFNLKEALEKDTPEQVKVKTALNSQIGKSIQRVFYPTKLVVEEGQIKEDSSVAPPHFTDSDLRAAFSKDSRYLLPQWGTRVYSAARLSIFRTCKKIIENNGEILYIDTDSIKFFSYGEIKDLEALIEEESIEAINRVKEQKIGESNKLGIWKFEYRFKDFKYFGLKNYTGEEENGNRVYVFAGLKKSVAEQYFRAFSIKDITKRSINISENYKPKKIMKYDYEKGIVWLNYTSYQLSEIQLGIELDLIRMRAVS